MDVDDKSRLLIGALVAVIVLAATYGVLREKGTQNPAVASPQPVAGAAQTEAPSESLPGSPQMRLVTEGSVPATATSHKAVIEGDSGLALAWSIKGGTLEGGTTGYQVSWRPGNEDRLVLTCTGTNAEGKSSIVSTTVLVKQPPVISLLEIRPAVITLGQSGKLRWEAKGFQTMVLTPGGQDLSKSLGSPFELKPEKTTTYTLTATTADGPSSSRDVILKVVPPPEIQGLRADPVAGSPGAYTVVAEFKGGKAELKQGGQVLASGETSPLRCSVTGQQVGAVLQFTVTNEAGSYVSNSLTFSSRAK